MKIKTKGMLFSFILILSATLCIGIGLYYRFKVIMVQELNTAVVRVAKESGDHLNNYINQYVMPLKSLSENEDIRSMNWQKQKEIINSQLLNQYQSVAVVDSNGIAHYIDNTTIDLSDREYIKHTLNGNIAYSDVLVSRKTGEPVIMVGVPIFEESKIIGALVARLDVDFLSEYATTRGYGKNGRAYIISESGALISCPDNEKDKEYNIYSKALSDTRYQSFSNFIQSSTSNYSGFGTYVFDDEKIMMGYSTIELTNWKVYIGTYEDEILKSLNGIKSMLIHMIAFTLVICSIAAWFFVDKFTKPIIELDTLFSKGALGDLTIRFTPKTRDEIGRVGISFNRMMDKIKTLTQYDPLTTLLNQYVLEKDVEALIQNEEEGYTLVMAAVDKLSFINDTYGYTVGDSILIEVAKRISFNDKDAAKVYRYKGDEFVVLYLIPLTESELDHKINKLLEVLTESYQINGKTIDITMSMGVYIWNDENRSQEPLKAVTQAKNYAKYLGSNQVQRYNKQTHDGIKKNKELQADIINGLKDNQFFLVYQPLFHLNTEEVAELEALIRWNHPDRGLLFPDKFIDLAEASGTILYIDQWVLESACQLLKYWSESKKPPILMSINISAKTFETKNFIPNLHEMINRYGVNPSQLQFEITERMVIKNVEESIAKLNEIRALGIKVAIDDFGIGYSSLSYIVRLPIDSIKIDKSFIQNIESSKEAKAIVSTIINLCKSLKLFVIAEGIERKHELDYLKTNQCDIGQGYYFSKPVSISEIERKHFN